MHDDLKHNTETGLVPAIQEQVTSQKHVDYHLGDKGVSTDAFSNNCAVKDELTDMTTNASVRIEIDSRRSGEGEGDVQPRLQRSSLRDW